MFTSSGAPSALCKCIEELKADIEERKREVRREEEINKSLEEEYQRKTEATRRLQEKTGELDEAVKKNHELYLNKKEAIESVKETTNLLKSQLQIKVAKLDELKQENQDFRASCENKLIQNKEKFEKYMEVYRTFPGVLEYEELRTKARNEKERKEELVQKVSSLEMEVAELEELNISRKKAHDSAPFKSITEWGVALAKKYMQYVEDQREVEMLQAQIKELKSANTGLEKQLEEKKQKQEKLKKEKERAQIMSSSLIRPCQTPVSTVLKSKRFEFTRKSVTFEKFLKSPLRSSVPNLSPMTNDVQKLKSGISVDLAKKSSFLTRSKSLSALPKGSSGATIGGTSLTKKPTISLTAPKSLQKWLNSAAVKSKNKTETPIVPNVALQPRSAPKFQEPMELDQDVGNLISLPNTNSAICDAAIVPPNKPPAKQLSLVSSTEVTPCRSPASFFQSVCNSPDDDFKFSVRSYKASKAGNQVTPVSSFAENEASTSIMFPLQFTSPPARLNVDDADFQFAVPSAPAPARVTKTNIPRMGESHEALNESGPSFFSGFMTPKSTSDPTSIYQSPFSFGSTGFSFGDNSDNAQPMGFSSLFGNASASPDSATGTNGEDGCRSFLGFGGDDASSPPAFSKLFGFGGNDD